MRVLGGLGGLVGCVAGEIDNQKKGNNASINAEFPPLGKTIYVNMCSCMVYSDVTGERNLWFSSYICNNHGHLNSHHNIIQGFYVFSKGLAFESSVFHKRIEPRSLRKYNMVISSIDCFILY